MASAHESLTAWDAQFGITPFVRFKAGRGGLSRIVVENLHGEAQIYLQGAHVTQFKARGQRPLLWVSSQSQWAPGKPIRGGIPICFPWFGLHPQAPSLPLHGFARLRTWEPLLAEQLDDGRTHLILGLHSDDATYELWPCDFDMNLHITVGRELELSLRVHNLAGQDITFEDAFHTYMAVSDVRQTAIFGLSGAEYVEKDVRGVQPEGPFILSGETGRNYMHNEAEVGVRDDGWSRRIMVSKSGSQVTVVWNPWNERAKTFSDLGADEWPEMLCVETVNARECGVVLPADGVHQMDVRLSATG